MHITIPKSLDYNILIDNVMSMKCIDKLLLNYRHRSIYIGKQLYIKLISHFSLIRCHPFNKLRQLKRIIVICRYR